MDIPPPSYMTNQQGRIAYRKIEGESPGIFWLGGFRSDMLGTKANHLSKWAQSNKRAFLRFDYSGHGESGGSFEDGSIGSWLTDALDIFDILAVGPQILVSSSMGGWIAALLAKARPERVHGIVFIAPAPDFTERLMWPGLTEIQRQTLITAGRLELPSDYSEAPEIITKHLIEEARSQLIMTGAIPIYCPVSILQGMKDEAVPWRHAIEFASQLMSKEVEILLTKEGDHRLSTPDDLERLTSVLAKFD